MEIEAGLAPHVTWWRFRCSLCSQWNDGAHYKHKSDAGGFVVSTTLLQHNPLTIPLNAGAFRGIPCKFPQKAHHYRHDIQILFVTLQHRFPRNLIKELR